MSKSSFKIPEQYKDHSLIKDLNLTDEEINRYGRIIVDNIEKYNNNEDYEAPYRKGNTIDFYYVTASPQADEENYLYGIPDNRKNIFLNTKTFTDRKDSKRYKLLIGYKKWMENPSPKGLFVYGKGGVGKTYITYGFLNSLALQGKKVALFELAALVQELKTSFDGTAVAISKINNMITAAKKADVVVIDDIGAEGPKEWIYNGDLYTNIIKFRVDNEKPTFYVSNYSLDEYKKFLVTKGVPILVVNRFTDRIIEATSEEILVDGENWRKHNK